MPGAQSHHTDRTITLLLAGQSNMAGRGSLSQGSSDATTVDPRVLAWTRDAGWQIAIDPIHWDKPEAGVGPGISCAVAILQAGAADRVRLIPAAVGGSSISVWEPGALHSDTGAYPYDDAISRTRAALGENAPDAILWHQGESDATPESSPTYKRRLHALIARFRSAFSLPDLPFIAGTLGTFLCDENKWASRISDVIRSLPANVPATCWVDSKELKARGDGLHFDAESARELGRRYGQSYLQLVRDAR